MSGQIDKIIDYQAVFESPKGKQVLYDLMKTHWIMSSHPYSDPYANAFHEGERNVVLRIMTKLEIDPIKLRNNIQEGKQNDGYYSTDNGIDG